MLSPDLRAAYRAVFEAFPPGASVTLLREHALQLLGGGAVAPFQPSLEADLTCKTAGAIIGRHDSTVRSMCERGEFPNAYRHNGREWRIPAGAVRSYQSAQRSGQHSVERNQRQAGGRPPDISAWRKARAGR